jgi:hypothetical protein
MKKVLCFVLAFVMCLSMATPAFAAVSTSTDNKIVANYYVFVLRTDVHPIGHMWVYLENLTDDPMQVGLYTVPAHEGVSVGVFSRKDGKGIYYNVEAYTQTVYGMQGQICLKDQLTAKKVKDVSDALIRYRNHWDPIFNCMYFAFRIWNAGCSNSKKLIPLIWPPIGTMQIKMKGYQRGVVMKGVTMDKALRQVGSGSKAYLRQANYNSLGRI